MFSDPEKNIQQFKLSSGISVADLGSGSGFYTLAAAAAIQGGNGKVYAIDVQKEMLDRTLTEAGNKHLTNIEIVWGDAEEPQGTKLRDESIDAVIIANTLFQIDDKPGLVKEAYRILKPGGRVLVVDWTESFGGLGPQGGHVVTKDSARSILEAQNFTFTEDIEAGAHHYGMIFHKA